MPTPERVFLYIGKDDILPSLYAMLNKRPEEGLHARSGEVMEGGSLVHVGFNLSNEA